MDSIEALTVTRRPVTRRDAAARVRAYFVTATTLRSFFSYEIDSKRRNSIPTAVLNYTIPFAMDDTILIEKTLSRCSHGFIC